MCGSVRPSKFTCVGIESVFHLGGASYDIADRFKKLVSTGAIDIEKLRLVTINYDTSSGEPEKGPVRLYFTDGLAIYLNLTAGYSGSSPTDLCEVLNLCKIQFDKNDIVSDQDVVDIKYIVGDSHWQFSLPDGTFIYSF